MELVVGLIGAGIGPSLSPALHEREAGELGLRYHYRLLDLDELRLAPERVGELLDRVRAQGYRGVNVTHPCKRLVLPYLDAIAPDAAQVGAVNTIVFGPDGAVGHNTDRTGFARGMHAGLPDARLGRVVLLGAGGAGAAAAHALLDLGTKELAVVDVDAAAAARLAGATGGIAGRPADLPRLLAGADGLVHATPTGMATHPGLPLPAELLDPRLWIAEIVYRPLRTALLAAARRRGCRTVDGGAMAVHQAVDALALFTDATPDPDRMARHFAQLVDAEDADHAELAT